MNRRKPDEQLPMLIDPEQAPEGFAIWTDAHGAVIIEYRSRGVTGMLRFIGFMLVAGVGGAIGFESAYPGALASFWQDGWFTKLCTVCASLAILGMVRFLLFHLFGHTALRFHPDVLEVRRRFFGMSWGGRIARERMRLVKQYKDGGEGEDTFPSWGVHIRGKWEGNWLMWLTPLLERQPYEQSEWLARVLADWYGVELERAEKT
jgi:hypothetical protein